ncbi:TPA: DUF6436 domain-containing protein [Pseudomonas aeruginosa]|uniref:Thiol-disulfide isomerase n=5 Tax=Pseudomonas aeruginosa TaxID=287 RepID=A0A2V3DDV0_PSEAI|nr:MULTISPECIES: DUF6436 domain-containing protein [Pseudomonas]EQL43895.1 thiol-disulfide isomerase [Pseudomonas aeruginosa VRFPA03]ESR67095.1 thiol-disulfide isomerase [Pseudomonas aeruginosa VRFPA05]SSU20468.1 Uncharacterised protein [Acinetobacter baumannii]AJF52397.1 thiol-disulfide isomerase [Pseudomonas aeruginosa]AKE66993.1 thiol-disulfide isomerase [Pseudomonas aeruginosa]
MASLAPVFRVNAMTPRRKTLLVSLVGLLWAGGLLAAYWWFEIRYIRPFSEQTTLFSGDSLRLPAELAGPGPIRLVHFWDPACPCNVGNQQHLGELIERFAGKGVEFHVLQKPGSQGRLPDNLAALRPLAGLPGSEQLPASPAVAIWDRDGRLAYFGPYSEGAVCTSSNSFIEPILEALLQGRPVDATHTLAVGCYCPWTPEKG